MSSTIERPPAASLVAHATEYPADRENRERDDHRRQNSESETSSRPEAGDPQEQDPAVVVDTHHYESHVLDGVSAYQAAAHHALDKAAHASADAHPVPVHRAVYGPGLLDPGPQGRGRIVPETIRHAYEDHEPEPPHQVNMAT
ncbi:hypothetical protein GCM10011316_07530 [Roseibium aquae]|uniref:Uncharacterized protein n=1 Tax=Roseibium aquae TaxID=1323746 RepID=A0A916TD10_9HYPH|nr:hypothetical protein [Roseibium aquae]GGB37930.1 hypothetical protein GCM10011316_07530 [Roseibium aquae]